MRKHWPPLNTLRGFEAAARLGSFHQAAQELHLTQSAISQQIRSLEDYLEQPLFVRSGRSVRLTDAGVDLLNSTQAVLQQLEVGIQRLDQFKKPNQLVLNTTPALARHWLLPRLANFRRQQPHIDVWLYSTPQAPVAGRHTFDISVRDDLGPQQGYQLRALCSDRLFAACHPAVLALPPAQRVTLHGERQLDWSHWQALGGPDVGQQSTGLNFSDPDLLLDAACSGLGIALVSELLSQGACASGQLLALAQHHITGAPWAYLVNQEHENSPRLRSFCDWLHTEIARRPVAAQKSNEIGL